MHYIEAVKLNWPNSLMVSHGDDDTYESIQWNEFNDYNPTKAEVDAFILTKHKEDRCAEVNDYRDTIFSAGFSWNGHSYDANDAARANVSGAALGAVCMGVAQDNTNIFTQWRTKDNQVVPLTGAALVTLGLSLMQWYSTVMAKSWAHKDAILSLPTYDAVCAYDITTNW